MFPFVNEVHIKNKREQIKTLLLSNRDFVYYYADFDFYYEQTVIAPMSTVRALVKKGNRNSFIQERKIMFFTVVIHVFSFTLDLQVFCYTLNFYWKFSKNF